MSSITDTDFKMTTEKKILKKKTHIVKNKKDGINYKFDVINSTNIINKTEQNETMTMTEQQKQTEISRRVKNYWLREKKNKLICLIGIGQTLKEEEEEKKKEQVGDMKCVVRRISRFRPNPFPEIDALGEAWRGWCAGLPSHNRRLHPSPSLHPSKIIHARLEDWTHKNGDKIKKKMMANIRISTSIKGDNSISARIHGNAMSFKSPFEKEFKKCEIVFDKDIAPNCDTITYYDVLDWKSSVFSTLKYARHFCELRRYDDDVLHNLYAKLYKGCVNENTLVAHPRNPTFGKWFNPSKYASSYGNRSCRQVFPADLIKDEASYTRELSKITDGKTIDGEVIHDFVPHIEISHNWEKTSKWSSLKWKIVSTFNLIPKMCANLNISITIFKKLYLLMLKDLKKRTFTADPYDMTKKKSLWALFHNKWRQDCDFEKIIYAFSEGLYISDASNLRQFSPSPQSTHHLNLTFKNKVAGTEYEIDFTDLIVMAMMIGSNGSTRGACSTSLSAGGSYTGQPLFMYARNWDMSPSSIKRTSSYLINSKLYPELCILKATDTTAISPYY